MFLSVAIPVGMGLLGMSEQRKANSQASDAASRANEANNALRNQAMPYALENLKTNQALQQFYQQNPFNDQQKTGYQNANNLIDSFNSQTGPGLLGMANQMMSNGYQRGGSTLAPNQQGLLSAAGPFAMPQMQAFGQIDWQKQNPFSQVNRPAPAAEALNIPPAVLENLPPDVLQQIGLDWQNTGG